MARALVYEDDTTGWRTFQNGDLPTSGVTPGTYGDATHVAQVVLNAQGIATSATNVAITGGSGSVTNVSSANAGIGVANPTTTPVLTLASLSAIVAAVGVGGNWSNGGNKITNLANGSAASDAAAFGQIPTVPGGAGLATLFDQTLSVDTSTIDTGANGVTQTSNHLLVICVARTDQATELGSYTLNLNNDSGANYDRQTLRVQATTVTGVASTAQTAWVLPAFGASAGVGEFALTYMLIGAYTETTAQKQAMSLASQSDFPTSGNFRAEMSGLAWRSTAAISRMAMANSGGTVLKAGSRLSIYGIG